MKNRKKRIGYFIVTLLAAFLFVTVAPLDSVGITNTTVADAATKINTKKVSIPKGSQYTLKVTGTSKKVTWSTSNNKVATVKNGVVTTKKAGSAVITAKVGKTKYTCKVAVLNCKINSTNVVMTNGKSYTLKVSGTSSKAKYKSSNTKVATVHSKTGKITAKKNGTSVITVTVGKSSFAVPVKVETPTINKSKLTLDKGKTYTLKVNSTRPVKWKSSNTSVATVNSSGKVTAKKKGSAVITATLNDRTLSCTVKVQQNPIINCPSSITVDLGQTVTYKITAGDLFDYSSTKGNVSVDILPNKYSAGDTLTMTIKGETVGKDTIKFVCKNGWEKVINVTVTGTELEVISLSSTQNNVKINSLTAYKGTGTNPLISIAGSITNNNSTTLEYLHINYGFYDEELNLLDTYQVEIKSPEKGKTYTFKKNFDPKSSLYPKGATYVIISSIDGIQPSSYKDASVSTNVPTTVEENDSHIELSDFSVQQNYHDVYNNIYDIKYSFKATNKGAAQTAYVCFFFFDKDGNFILLNGLLYTTVTLSDNASEVITGELTNVLGGIPYGDIDSIKLLVTIEDMDYE